MTADAVPPLVFIAQLGTDGASWNPVLERLTTAARTFTYDRPGTGDAPPRPAPNPPIPHSVFARELGSLLEAEGITEPAVVVGHSFGGNIARVYAGMRPGRVAGIVFVDCSIPQSFLVPGGYAPVDGDGPDATTLDTVAGQVDIMTAEIPRVPAVVMVRQPQWWMGGFDQIPHPAVDDLWQLSQRQLAEQFGAPLVTAGTAGHQIPAEAPGLTAFVIDSVVSAVSTGAPVTLDIDRLARLGGSMEPPSR